MSVETFHGGRVTLHGGDCLDILATLPEASVDAIVTDPPYHFASIVKRFGKPESAALKGTGALQRTAKGFMGKEWDGGGIAHDPATWAAVLRVLKPGGHLVAFHAPKNWHRQVTAIEDAGFEIRDSGLDLYSSGDMAQRFIASLSADQQQALARIIEAGDPLGDLFWLFGSGFPKSHDVARAIDKRRKEDEEPRRIICRAIRAAMDVKGLHSKDLVHLFDGCHPRLIDHWAARDTDSQPATPTVAQWQVLKTALDIASDFDSEVHRLNARKGQASDAFLAADVIGMHTKEAFGFVGERFEGAKEIRALSDDASRFQGLGTALKPAYEPIVLARKPFRGSVADCMQEYGTGAINIDGCRIGDEVRQAAYTSQSEVKTYEGRWPANVTHDGSAEVVAGFPNTTSGNLSPDMDIKASTGWSGGSQANRVKSVFQANSGSAARFFYSAKADADDRLGSKHPTVKPIGLMRWLVRMITPPGGVVLDPFAGTGTTAQAAYAEGCSAILIEREPEYRNDIRRRMDLMLAGPMAKTAAVNDAPPDYGPLFNGGRSMTSHARPVSSGLYHADNHLLTKRGQRLVVQVKPRRVVGVEQPAHGLLVDAELIGQGAFRHAGSVPGNVNARLGRQRGRQGDAIRFICLPFSGWRPLQFHFVLNAAMNCHRKRLAHFLKRLMLGCAGRDRFRHYRAIGMPFTFLMSKLDRVGPVSISHLLSLIFSSIHNNRDGVSWGYRPRLKVGGVDTKLFANSTDKEGRKFAALDSGDAAAQSRPVMASFAPVLLQVKLQFVFSCVFPKHLDEDFPFHSPRSLRFDDYLSDIRVRMSSTIGQKCPNFLGGRHA